MRHTVTHTCCQVLIPGMDSVTLPLAMRSTASQGSFFLTKRRMLAQHNFHKNKSQQTEVAETNQPNVLAKSEPVPKGISCEKEL